jgi:hypothetical protein
MRICRRSLLFNQYLNQRENQRIAVPFSVRSSGKNPPFFGMNPILRPLEEPPDKQRHIKIYKIFAIVERNLAIQEIWLFIITGENLQESFRGEGVARH